MSVAKENITDNYAPSGRFPLEITIKIRMA